jgi:hypothetical protein
MYKHIKLMHNELRYQAKTHTNLKSYLLPNFYFFLLKTIKQKKIKINKDMLMEKEMTSSLNM